VRYLRKIPRRRLIAIVLAFFTFFLSIDYCAFPYGRWNNGHSVNRGENGLWLRYTWYFGQDSPVEMQAMTQRLICERIHYAYFHVRSIRKDGTLNFKYADKARLLVANVHRQAPEVKVIAWAYVGNSRGAGRVDLSNPNVRRTMVKEASWLTTDCGFDGIQWDYEICENGDAGLISLLRESRAPLGPKKVLSVAEAVWVPRPLRHWGWGDDYIRRVAANCDQITVMDYDTACWLPRAYVWLTHQQVVHLRRLLHRVTLIVVYWSVFRRIVTVPGRIYPTQKTLGWLYWECARAW
jgi:hypothetical protein